MNNQRTNKFIKILPVEIPEEYRKERNITSSDFVKIYNSKNELISNHLYRIGGIGFDLSKDSYFLMLKYKESVYEDKITKDPSKKKHLSSHWCIFDKYGIELVEFKRFDIPYLVSDSCIYSDKGIYKNAETGEVYGYSSKSCMNSLDFIFLDLTYDPERQGIMKIDKKTGKFEVYPR